MSSGLSFLPAEGYFKSARVRLNKDFVIQGRLVPKGFVSDGASIPRWLPLLGLIFLLLADMVSGWFYFPAVIFLLSLVFFARWGIAFWASILHDYELERDVDDWWRAGILFYKQLKEDGMWVVVAEGAFLLMSFWQLCAAIQRALIKKCFSGSG